MLNKDQIKIVAEKLFQANKKKDYNLYQHLIKGYSNEERKEIEKELNVIVKDYFAAQKPIYFK